MKKRKHEARYANNHAKRDKNGRFVSILPKSEFGIWDAQAMVDTTKADSQHAVREKMNDQDFLDTVLKPLTRKEILEQEGRATEYLNEKLTVTRTIMQEYEENPKLDTAEIKSPIVCPIVVQTVPSRSFNHVVYPPLNLGTESAVAENLEVANVEPEIPAKNNLWKKIWNSFIRLWK